MTDNVLPASDPLVTGAEIARLAGVTRAAVSNWRRRYADFPASVGGSSSSPLFSLAEVRSWLAQQGKGHDAPDEMRLWQAVCGLYGDNVLKGLTDIAEFLTQHGSPGLDPGLGELATALAKRSSAAELVEGLVERFLDLSRRGGSDRATSPRLVAAIRRFADPLPTAGTFLNPSCRIGTLMLHLASQGSFKVVGQEADPVAARLAQLRAELSGRGEIAIEAGDSLRDDRSPGLQADLVVCDPPAATSDWGREDLLLDARWELGVPPRSEGELAWLQHCYAHAAPGGRVLTVMPASAAYRKAGRRIRAELVRRQILTQVVALPPGMAASHSLPVHLWILRRPESPDDAVASVRMTDLTANDPDGCLEPRPDQVADVPLIDLLDETVDLTPGVHVSGFHRDFPAEYEAARHELERRFRELVDLLPLLAEGPGSLEGAVSVTDLARAGIVELSDGQAVSTSGQLDDGYLNGFMRGSGSNRRSAGSGAYRSDARGARIPQMAVEEQRRYGAAFRALQEFEERIATIAALGADAAELAREGLTSGALAPSADDAEPLPGE